MNVLQRFQPIMIIAADACRARWFDGVGTNRRARQDGVHDGRCRRSRTASWSFRTARSRPSAWPARSRCRRVSACSRPPSSRPAWSTPTARSVSPAFCNQDHDQDQLERSAPIQPELRAIDAFNAQEDLIEWIRSFGVTTIHTGHAPGELISGQTLIAKTAGRTASRRRDRRGHGRGSHAWARPAKKPAANRPARAARRSPCCAPS